eukprot:GDKI01000252.1.p1 GENE.GDKI01000252.1~~GDKI01000252.1.p1  ORF type:complete len:241 (+),score=43.67 GDKI01000252.1:119-841(+)
MPTIKPCSHCHFPSCSGYSQWKINDPFIASFKPPTNSDHPTAKFGTLVACAKCKALWLRTDPNTEGYCDLTPVPKSAGALHYLATRMVPEGAVLSALQSIRCTGGDVYGNGQGTYIFPCKVTTKDGTVHERAYVVLAEKASVPGDGSLFLEEVACVEASGHALPAGVRWQTTQAQEVSNSYAPTRVRTHTGDTITLNWTNHFWPEKTGDQTVTILGDWTDELSSAVITSAAGSEHMIVPT